MTIHANKLFKQIALLAAGGLLLTSCAATNSQSASEDGTPETFTVGIQDPWQALPFHVAEEAGIFEANNVDLEFQTFSSVSAMTAALSSGDIDAAAQAIQTVQGYNASSSGAEMLFFAPMQINDTVILAREGSDIPVAEEDNWKPTFQALKNKTVGITAVGGFSDGSLNYAAKEAGLDPTQDVTSIAVGIGPSAQAAIEQEQIDAVYELSRGMGEQLREELSYMVIDFAGSNAPDELSNLLGGGLFAPEDLLDNNSETYNNVAQALTETRDFIADPSNEELLSKVISEEYAPDNDEMRDFLLSRSYIFSEVELTDEALERAIKGYAAAGMVDADTTPSELVWNAE